MESFPSEGRAVKQFWACHILRKRKANLGVTRTKRHEQQLQKKGSIYAPIRIKELVFTTQCSRAKYKC